jgi:hypothetical protein
VAIGIMMIAMVMIMIVKKKEEELTGEVIGMAVADVETIGMAIGMATGMAIVTAIGTAIGKAIMMIVAANLKRSGRSTGDRELPPDNKGARKHLSTTLTGMYV